MGIAVIILLLIVLVVVARQAMLHYPVRQPRGESFDGVIHAVGKATVSVRDGGENPRASVICMPGFCENPRYFTQHYAQPDIQLILIGSCEYHLPFTGARFEQADWATPPSASEGSIEYDAHVLVQALENLPRAGMVRVHGHSRGGAVVLEAAAMRPELFENVETVLEAPVLPQGKTFAPLSPVLFWLAPFVAGLWRLMPISPVNRKAYGSLDNPRKRELISGLPFNGKHAAVLVENMESMAVWMRERPYDMFQFVSGVVLVPEQDRVLVPGPMKRSAERGPSGLEVVTVADSSHFVLMDRPEAIPALPETSYVT